MKSKPANACKCMKPYYTHRIPFICFGHSCGLPQGGALQRTDTVKYDNVFEPMYWYKMLIKKYMV